MSCFDPQLHEKPVCGGPPVGMCVKKPSDPIAFPAWVTATCVAGEVTGYNLFADSAATDPLPGYTIADRTTCPPSLLGLVCETAIVADLCPDTIGEFTTLFEDQTSDLQGSIANQTAALLPVNYSYSGFVYDLAGNLEEIVRTVGAVSQKKTFTYGVDGLLATATAWVTV